MPQTLIDQGISLMLYGMGTVFLFLTILVFATGLMSLLVRRVSSEPAQADRPSGNIAGQPNSQLVEAIKKAIAMHRNR